jgi:chemotaxis signal transduction protein
MTSRGGMLIKIDGAPHFIDANEAVAIERAPRIERLPGAPAEIAGITAYKGAIIPVIALSTSTTPAMIVVKHASELVGLIGAEIVGTGIFTDENAPLLDIGALHARVHGGGWAGRWGN